MVKGLNKGDKILQPMKQESSVKSRKACWLLTFLMYVQHFGDGDGVKQVKDGWVGGFPRVSSPGSCRQTAMVCGLLAAC